MPATGPNPDLARVYQDALDAGLDEEGARVAVAIATTEHGYAGGVGDLDRSELGSAGTFQLYFGGGMGDAYAAAHGMSKREARDYLKANPHAANDWALSPSGYLGRAIRDGQAKGLHGADLATYAQRYGQRSESPERSGANYQTVSMETGGGSVDTSGDRPSSEFDTTSPRPATQPGTAPAGRGVYDRIVATKGDPISIRPAPGQETVKRTHYDQLGAPDGTEEVPNPNPVYRYTFQDGTYVDADSTTVGGSDLSIKGGTALASVARQPAGQQPTTVNTSANEQYIVTRMPDGSLKREPNPNYVAPKAPATPTKPAGTILGGQTPNEQYITIVNPDGTVTQQPNPNYTAPKGPAKTTHALGGRLYTLDADGNVVNSQDLRTPEEKAKEALDLQKGQVDLQKAQRALLPAAQQVMQGLHDSISYLQGLYEKGQIQLPEMNAYVQMFKDAAEAQLRGTTPAEEAAAKQKAKESDQTLGLNLLNQRLVSGTGLAKSLMDSALGPNVMLRPGQTSLGIDPLSSLLPLLNQLGGGADIPGYARGLLMGGQNGAPPQAGPAPAGL